MIRRPTWNIYSFYLKRLVPYNSWWSLGRYFTSQNIIRMDSLLPPASVRGMKVLKKDQFTKEIQVPCLFVDPKVVHKAKDHLKNYVLKLQMFKPLQTINDFIKLVNDAESKDKLSKLNTTGTSKILILDPRTVSLYSDIHEEHREVLKTFNITENNFMHVLMLMKFEHWKADEILRAIIPEDVDSVSGYSNIGHIVHLNLRENLNDYKTVIGQVLLDKVKTARTIVNKVDNIDSTYRNFKMEVLCGDTNMVTTVRENGCAFEFDFSTVYWNPRLSTEHERIVSKLKKGDILYDVFSGVGPFAVPAALKGCTVLANDLNPESYKWLKKNAKLNKAETNIKAYNYDGSYFIKEVLKTHLLSIEPNPNSNIHITMNLPALAYTFLGSFKGLLPLEHMEHFRKLPPPVVYLYCFSKGLEDPAITARNLVENELNMNLDDEIKDISFVRNVAPNKEMMRVSIFLTERIVGQALDKRPLELEESQTNKKFCL